MPTLADIRAQYPQYNDLSDDALEDKLYNKFYSDMPRAEFYKRLSVNGVSSEIQKGGDDLSFRSTILPLGKTKEGKIVPAVPGAIKSLIDLPQQLIQAGHAGPPGSREVTEAAIAPAAETAMALGPTSAAGGAVRDLLRKPTIPTTDELHEAGTAAYKAAEQSGVAIKADSFAKMVLDLAQELKTQGFDKDLQTRAVPAVRRLAEAAASRKESGQPVSITEFDQLRKIAQAAAKSSEADDRRIGGLIKGHMDDFLSNITINDVDGKHAPEAAVASLKQARELWARYSKSAEIDRLFENASLSAGNYSAAGYENALRNEFKTLAKNQNRIRKFSPDEQEAIKAVAKGSKLQTALTKIGKFSPTSGFFAAVITGDIALKAATNPYLLAIPGIGAVAKYAATALRERTAEGARKIVAGGKEAAEYIRKKNLQRLRITIPLSKAAAGGAIGGLGQSSPLSPDDQNNP